MPTPVSSTLAHASAPALHALTVMVPPRLVLRQPREVGVHPERGVGQRHAQVVAGDVDQRLRRFDRALQHRAQVDRLGTQLHSVAGNARDVEQVVGQPHQLMELPLHDRQGRLGDAGIAAGPPHQLEGVADRRQRVAQLVRQRRQEFILAAIGFAQHLLDTPPLGHIDADADAAADDAGGVVERLDVVLDEENRSVGADDLDVVGDVGAVGDGELHRQLVNRELAPLALNPVDRLLPRRRRQRDVDPRRHVEHAGERGVGGDELALRVVRDGDRHGRALDERRERTDLAFQLVAGRVLGRIERDLELGHEAVRLTHFRRTIGRCRTCRRSRSMATDRAMVWRTPLPRSVELQPPGRARTRPREDR
jgi:hypothetical protein